MKHIFVLLTLLIVTSCAKRVTVTPAPNLVSTQHYAYVKDADGRVWIFTASTQDFDVAMKDLHPGPASVDKLNVWVVTPAPARPDKGTH